MALVGHRDGRYCFKGGKEKRSVGQENVLVYGDCAGEWRRHSLMSVPRTMARMRKDVSGSGIAKMMNARNDVILGMLLWIV